MAMTTLEYDTLNNIFAICNGILSELHSKLSNLQQIYDSEGGVSDTLTQEDLDSMAHFSGLTKQQVDDGVYVLTALLLPAVNQGYPSLSQLSARHRGLAMPMPVNNPITFGPPNPA